MWSIHSFTLLNMRFFKFQPNLQPHQASKHGIQRTL
ncbi:hypothetical protein LINGRAHAP2_LOCUS1814 [Linum grandiflorum]